MQKYILTRLTIYLVSILSQDEECLRPGEPTDGTFLEKLDKNLGQHPHYISHSTDAAARKSIGRDVRGPANVLYNNLVEVTCSCCFLHTLLFGASYECSHSNVFLSGVSSTPFCRGGNLQYPRIFG